MRRSILAALLAAIRVGRFRRSNAQGSVARPARATRRTSSSFPPPASMATNICGPLPDGRMAFRQSILLRGLIFETDETMRVRRRRHADRDRHPRRDAERRRCRDIRDRERQGRLDQPGRQGRRGLSRRLLIIVSQGGPFLSVRAADRPAARRPGPRAWRCCRRARQRSQKVTSLEVDGPQGEEASRPDLAARDRADSAAGVGRERQVLRRAGRPRAAARRATKPIMDKMQAAQDAAIAALAPATAEEVPDRRCQAAGAVPQRQDLRRRRASGSSPTRTCSTADGKIVSGRRPRRPSCRPARA